MNKNCVTCGNFAWWDGDYCCLKNFFILCTSKDGEFNNEILQNIKTPDTCLDYIDGYCNSLYEDAFKNFLKSKENE